MYNQNMMNWNHNNFRADGKPIINPGKLAILNLAATAGYYRVVGEKFKTGLENWKFFIPEIRNEFNNEDPVVMVFDLNIEETYYKVALGEQFVWIRFEALNAI